MSTNLPGGDPRFGPAAPSPAVATPRTPPPPRPTTGTPRWLVASAFGVLALLALTGAVIWQNQARTDAAKRKVFEHTRVSTPETVMGLQQGVGPGMESAQSRLNLALAQGGAVDPVYAAYVDGDGNSAAIVAGARRVTTAGDLSSTAQATAEHFSSGLGSAGSSPVTVSEVPAGELGGVMLCGATTIAELPATYCVAVDEGSVTEFLVGSGDVTQGTATATGLRQAMVTRTA